MAIRAFILSLLLLFPVSVFAAGTAKEFSDKGREFAAQGQYEEAVVSYSRAIELEDNYADAYYGRGQAYGQKGDYDKAIADMNKVMVLDPGFAPAYNDRAVIYCLKGEFEKAKEDIKRAEGLGYKVNPRFIKDIEEIQAKEKAQAEEKPAPSVPQQESN